MKKLISIITIAALMFASLSGCTASDRHERFKARENSTTPDDDTLNIVATIFPLYDFTRAIVNDNANVTMLLNPGTEIHSYDPSPADIIKIQNADIFIHIGEERGSWVERILDSMDTSDKKIIKLMDYIDLIGEEVVEGMHEYYLDDDHDHDDDHHHDHDDDHDDDHHHDHDEHSEYDEHIWTSPKNAISMINTIAHYISEIDSKNSEIYLQNAKAYTGEIEEIHNEIQKVVDTAERDILIFGDRFPFVYFVKEYGLDYRAAFTGCSTESEASAGTLAFLINTIREKNIPYIYHVELSTKNIARVLGEETGAEALLMHSIHNVSQSELESGESYVSLMRQNIESLRKGLN